jgi:hypothetical protein
MRSHLRPAPQVLPAALAALALVASAAVSACATGRSAAPGPSAAAPDAGELAGRNDQELFALGTAAAAAGDLARAAAAFDRLADAFPASPQASAAQYQAGLAHRGLEQWDRALGRFQQRAGGPPGPEADDAAFLAAEALDHLARRAEAHALLDRLAARTDLDAAHHVRALVERGVVELETGDTAAAERSLQAALAAWNEAAKSEAIPIYGAAQARFYLGEVARAAFEAAPLQPDADAERVAAQLEQKAKDLLAAQQHYLDAIRSGNSNWGVAAGARIGELYQTFYAQLVAAPVPPGLGGEEAQLYRDELHRRLRVLIAKAIEAYQETLTAARHTGTENTFVPRMEEGLARMQQLLRDEDAAEDRARAGQASP